MHLHAKVAKNLILYAFTYNFSFLSELYVFRYNYRFGAKQRRDFN
jgi:hypothetical protein